LGVGIARMKSRIWVWVQWQYTLIFYCTAGVAFTELRPALGIIGSGFGSGFGFECGSGFGSGFCG
jgi:hypothetical protein